MAKDDQKVLLARQAELQADLMRAKATDFTEAPSDSVGVGTIVDLKDSNTGDKMKYTILGAWDSDPENNILSYLTPLAQKNSRQQSWGKCRDRYRRQRAVSSYRRREPLGRP